MTRQEIEKRRAEINALYIGYHDTMKIINQLNLMDLLVEDILAGYPDKCSACGVDLSKTYEQVYNGSGQFAGIMEVKKEEQK